jgi:hypothetical protein
VIQCFNPSPDAINHHSFRCELAASTVVCLGLPELAALRQDPGLRFPPQVTPHFLKNSDDQTITTLAAVHEAIRNMDRSPEDFREWGVVSASRFVGRGAFAATLHKYGNDGPWGVSVQVVPHNLLHSVSSTISLSLPCQGPCLGAGGGPRGEVDALLAAANLLADPSRPGVWVTWSYWNPELQIDARGKPISESHCFATVLALQPLRENRPAAEIEIRAARTPQLRSSFTSDSQSSLKTLGNLVQAATHARTQELDVVCQLSGGLELELNWRPAASETLEMAQHSPVPAVSRQPLVLARAG